MLATVFDKVCVTAEWRTLLEPTTLTLAQQHTAIIGANGSGKSTFLKLISGLVQPTYGHVSVDGMDTIDQAPAVRARVGYVFAAPEAQLIMPTVSEDLELSLSVAGRRKRRAATPAHKFAGVQENVDTILDRFGLTGHNHTPVHALSGGQKQLLALAGVVIANPEIILCDEPTTRLDMLWRRRLIKILFDLPQQLIIATHDLDLAQQCERVIVIDEAAVVFDGEPAKAIAMYTDLMLERP